MENRARVSNRELCRARKARLHEELKTLDAQQLKLMLDLCKMLKAGRKIVSPSPRYCRVHHEMNCMSCLINVDSFLTR